MKCNILCKYEEEVINLRKELEEFKKIEEALSIQVTKKYASYCKLEEEVISLKMKLEEANKNVNKFSKFEKSSEMLDEMVKQQRDSNDKSGLGYVSEKPSTFKSTQKNPKDKSTNNKMDHERPHQKGTTSIYNGRRNATHQHQQARWT